MTPSMESASPHCSSAPPARGCWSAAAATEPNSSPPMSLQRSTRSPRGRRCFAPRARSSRVRSAGRAAGTIKLTFSMVGVNGCPPGWTSIGRSHRVIRHPASPQEDRPRRNPPIAEGRPALQAALDRARIRTGITKVPAERVGAARIWKAREGTAGLVEAGKHDRRLASAYPRPSAAGRGCGTAVSTVNA